MQLGLLHVKLDDENYDAASPRAASSSAEAASACGPSAAVDEHAPPLPLSPPPPLPPDTPAGAEMTHLGHIPAASALLLTAM